MKEQVASLETEVALIRKDIHALKNKEQQLPAWLLNSAMGILAGMFLQIITMVWWAASLSANVSNLSQEVELNTDFRMNFPVLHQEVMVELEGIKVNYKHIESMLHDVKDQLINKQGK